MFLYESLWDAASCLVLLWFTRRYWRRVPTGTVFALYVVLYNIVRLPLETMKIDPADHVLGQRINVWVAASRAHRRADLVRDRVPAPRPRAGAGSRAGHTEPSHVPTTRPEAAIAARRASQRRRRSG